MSRFRTIMGHIRRWFPDWLIDTATFATTTSGELAPSWSGYGADNQKMVVSEPEDALLLASRVDEGLPDEFFLGPTYRLILDLDVDAVLLPSTTPGHKHLIVDVRMHKRDHDKVLQVLAEAGVIEYGYAESGQNSELGSTIRLPWVKKGEDKTLAQQKGWVTKPEPARTPF